MRQRILLRGGIFDRQDVFASPEEALEGVYCRMGIRYVALGIFDEDGLMIFMASKSSARAETPLMGLKWYPQVSSMGRR